MIIASAVVAKQIKFLNGDMIVKTINDDMKIIPNTIIKYYSINSINIETEKSNNYIITQ